MYFRLSDMNLAGFDIWYLVGDKLAFAFFHRANNRNVPVSPVASRHDPRGTKWYRLLRTARCFSIDMCSLFVCLYWFSSSIVEIHVEKRAHVVGRSVLEQRC